MEPSPEAKHNHTRPINKTRKPYHWKYIGYDVHVHVFMMVIELTEVQFGLKWYV